MNDKTIEIVEAMPKRERATSVVVNPDATPMQMLAIMTQRGGSIADLKDLVVLAKDWEAGQARKAFNEAFAAFKAEAVKIIKGTQVKDGPLKGKFHANLFDVVSGTTPFLSKHALAISWKLSKDDPAWMEVTCTLRHALGHSESVSMGGPPDTGPGRNAIQARGSTKSYLERYTATAILGLAAQDMDNDGAGAPKEKPEEPKGYTEWSMDMDAKAEEGKAAHQEAWKESQQEFRNFATRHDADWWERSKAKAGKAGA